MSMQRADRARTGTGRFRIAQLDSQELLDLRDLSVCVNESSDAPAQHVAHAVPILRASARLEPDPVYLPELVYYSLRLGAFRISFLDVLDLVEDVRPAPLYIVSPVRYQPIAYDSPQP